MKKLLRYGMLGAGLLVVLAQLVRPSKENHAVDESVSIRLFDPPAKVLEVLQRSCFDCHSYETRWPWYSTITPINFLIAEDVRKARQRLNFSDWGKLKRIKQQGLLQMIEDQVSLKEMPLPRYLYLHPGAALSEAEIDAISAWVAEEQTRLSEPDQPGQKKK